MKIPSRFIELKNNGKAPVLLEGGGGGEERAIPVGGSKIGGYRKYEKWFW
jgi:hypothetical protein